MPKMNGLLHSPDSEPQLRARPRPTESQQPKVPAIHAYSIIPPPPPLPLAHPLQQPHLSPCIIHPRRISIQPLHRSVEVCCIVFQ